MIHMPIVGGRVSYNSNGKQPLYKLVCNLLKLTIVWIIPIFPSDSLQKERIFPQKVKKFPESPTSRQLSRNGPPMKIINKTLQNFQSFLRSVKMKPSSKSIASYKLPLGALSLQGRVFTCLF